MITWKKEISLPGGVEDVAFNILNNKIIYTGGFCGGFKKIKKSKYKRGHKNETYIIDIDKLDKWQKIDTFIGKPRQCMRACTIGNKMYCMGGFKYKPSVNVGVKSNVKKCKFEVFNDSYFLEYKNDKYTWNKFIDLPLKLSNFSICHNDNKIYLLGGGSIFDNSWQINVVDPKNNIINKYLYVLDLSNENKKWEILSEFKGTPRIDFNMNIINNEIYIIGGTYPNSKWKGGKYKRRSNTKDSWKYNLKTNEWMKLMLDVSKTSNYGTMVSNVYKNRYILLIGGYDYSNNKFMNDIILYDTEIDEIIKKDKYINEMAGLCYTIFNDKIYNLSGETSKIFKYDGETYTNHCDIFLTGEFNISL